jgi:hypothetical protein
MSRRGVVLDRNFEVLEESVAGVKTGRQVTRQYIKPPAMPGRLKRAEAIREVTKLL